MSFKCYRRVVYMSRRLEAQFLTVAFISRFIIRHFISLGTSRKAAIVTFCLKIIYGI